MINTRILIILLIIFSSFQTTPKPVDVIVLKDERLTIIPKEFYIAKVTDERTDKSPVASLVVAPASKGGSAKAYTVDLQGGVPMAIRQFIDHNLPHNTALRPIVISLKQVSIKETA